MREVFQGDIDGEGGSIYTLSCFLVFDPDPEMAGHDRAVWADDHFSKFHLPLIGFQHAGVYEAKVRDAPKFFVVIFHCFLDLHAQGCAGVVVKP